MGGLVGTWEDWVSHEATSKNSSVCESTGKTPYFIVYGREYNMEDYSKIQLNVFPDIHRDMKSRLLPFKTNMSTQQRRRSFPVNIRVGESVMVKVPERHFKLAPKFVA